MPDGPEDRQGRPAPEALLEEAKRAERSRLKIFVGAAPGVGKTYAMLQAARERLREGVDVVVGVVETHGRRETEALLEGLPVVPRVTVHYRGRTLQEMDLDAVLARRPALVLVDELAHTNAPGGRHPKRWLDVEEILDAGIDVYTTVNVQHLESLNDVVAQITGVRVRETVPDRILDRADEVKLIDLSPEELVQRLREGKVYVPEQAERALRNWFHPANLTALRELALRETAEHVDEQMQAHRRTRPAADTWAVSERILVAIGGGVLSERLVRAARRMAERRGTPWLAVFVETPGFAERPEAERERVHRALRLAEQLGGEALTIPGRAVAEDLLRLARERNVSEIIVGRSRRPRWSSLVWGSVPDDVVRHSAAIEVRVIGGEREEREEGGPALRAPRQRRHVFRGWAFAVVAVAVAGGVAAALTHALPLDDPSMVFLAAVLFTAVVGGLGPSILASLLGLAVWDFFFVEPRLTLTVTQPQDVLSLLVFLLVAVLTSNLVSRAGEQAEAARRRERRTATLYALARDVAAAPGIEELLAVLTEHVAREFRTPVVLLLPDGGRLVARASRPREVALPEAERATATWVWEHGRPAGRGTDTLPGGAWLHVPLASARGTFGVLALGNDDPERDLTDLPQRQLLEAIADQAAIALERARIDVVLEAQAKLEAVIESIEDGLVVLDRAGVVQHVNDVACAILQVERPDAVGVRFAQLGTSHPHYLRLRAAAADFLAHPEREHEPIELALYLRGRDHYYVLRPTPLRARDGTHAGFVLVLQDVTYLRDHEARREQLVATLSHELRTPITSLRMAVDLLQRGRTPAGERPGVLAAAADDIARLEDVTRRLLDVSKSRAMSIALERQHVHVDEVVERCSRIFGLQARERGVTIATEVGAGDLRVVGDATKLTWALSNLIANALRYSPRGAVVTLAAAADDGTVRVSVTDRGPGIPPAARDRIFERFVQDPDGGEPGAAGLGLAIVRDIVQAHGGRIFLDSDVGRGSRFTIELPRR